MFQDLNLYVYIFVHKRVTLGLIFCTWNQGSNRSWILIYLNSTQVKANKAHVSDSSVISFYVSLLFSLLFGINDVIICQDILCTNGDIILYIECRKQKILIFEFKTNLFQLLHCSNDDQLILFKTSISKTLKSLNKPKAKQTLSLYIQNG